MVIYQVSLLPARSNGLPRGISEADRFIPPYLAFLPVGFAMPLMSPSERWALTLSRYLSLFLTRGNDPAISPLFHQKDGTVYFLLHFPSRHRDSALRSTVPCGARTYLPSLPFVRTVRTDDHLVYLIFS